MLLKHYRFLARLLSARETTFLCGVCQTVALVQNTQTNSHMSTFFFFFPSGTADREVKLMGTGGGRLEKEKLHGTVWDHSTGVRAASTGPESPLHRCRSSFLTNQAALCSATISLLLQTLH